MKVNLKIGNLFKILISLKAVGNRSDNFNDESFDHVEIKFN